MILDNHNKKELTIKKFTKNKNPFILKKYFIYIY